jgi:hypothetical protein
MKQDIKEIYSEFDNNFTFSPSLNQGDLFNSIQVKKKKKETTKKKIELVETTKVEAFSLDTPSSGQQSQDVLDQTVPSQKEIDEIIALKNQYNHVVDQYKSLNTESLSNAVNFLNRSDPSTNMYAGKNITFTSSASDSNVTGYVTQMGIFKPYPQDNNVTYKKTSGKNNCPTEKIPVSKNIDNGYDTGTYLQTNPQLLVGSVMSPGQSCGNEGKNVYVNQVISDGGFSYKKCVDNTLNVTLLNGGSSSFTFDACVQGAIDGGYQNFALKNVDKNGIGQCAVTNDSTSITNSTDAFTYVTIKLWALYNYNVNGVSLPLSSVGLRGYTSKQMTNYLGCYGDRGDRAIPLLNNGSVSYTYTSCMQQAQNSGNQYFGLQYVQPSGYAQCGVTNDIDRAKRYGGAGNCTNRNENGSTVSYGGGWSNAVYSVQSYNFYFLMLQDDGNMCIYRGSGPQDNQGIIWCSNTAGKQKDPNPNYVAVKGKNGQNWISSKNKISSTVTSLDEFMASAITASDNIKWIGSTNGSIYLMLEPDGNLTLNTSQKNSACVSFGENFMTSNTNANAVYELSAKGIPEAVGKFGYIDQNSELLEYPESMIKYDDSYTSINGYNYIPGSIPGKLLQNSTITSCQSLCNSIENCAGFTYETSTKNCILKSDIPKLTSNMTPDPRYNIIKRRQVVINSPVPETTAIDSVQWQSYNKSSSKMSPNMNIDNIQFVNQQQLNDISKQLQDLAKTINDKTTKIQTKRLTQEQQLELNSVSMKSLTQSFEETNQKIKKDETAKQKEGFINMNRVLEESNLVVNQERIHHILWSTLAIVVGLVFIKVMNSN